MVLGWLPVSGADTDGPSVDKALDELRDYAGLGIDHVLMATSTPSPKEPDPTTFARFADEIVPWANELPVAGRW